MSDSAPISPEGILGLIHEELKRQIAESLDAEWKAAVLGIAEQQEREYMVFTAFKNCLTSALESVRRFPEQYRKMQGKTSVSPSIQRYREENQPTGPLMTEAQRRAILEKAAARAPKGLRETFIKALEGEGEEEKPQ